MTDFSKPHRGVTYFGLFAEDTADDYGRRTAVTILGAAAERCTDEDMREDREVRDALDYLTRYGHDKRAMQFRKALDVPHPHQRRHAAAEAVHAIQGALGQAWGKTPARL